MTFNWFYSFSLSEVYIYVHTFDCVIGLGYDLGNTFKKTNV